MTNKVDPDHYKKLSPEPITVIEKWKLGFLPASALSYIARAGHKVGEDYQTEMMKAANYCYRAATGRWLPQSVMEGMTEANWKGYSPNLADPKQPQPTDACVRDTHRTPTGNDVDAATALNWDRPPTPPGPNKAHGYGTIPRVYPSYDKDWRP